MRWPGHRHGQGKEIAADRSLTPTAGFGQSWPKQVLEICKTLTAIGYSEL